MTKLSDKSFKSEMNEVVSNIVVSGDTVYGVGNNTKRLFRMNIHTGDAEYICGINGREYFNNNRPPLMRLCGDTIFCMPESCDLMYRYSIKNNSCTLISKMEEQDYRYSSYIVMETFKDQLFVFFCNELGICKFSDSMKRVSCPDYGKIDKREMISFRVGNIVFLLEYSTGKVWSFDLETERLTLVDDAPSIQGAGGVIYKDGYVYVVFDHRSLLKWNLNTGEFETIEDYYDTKKMIHATFSYFVPAGNKLLLIPALANEILVSDMGGIFEKYENYPEDYHYIRSEKWLNKGSKFSLMSETDEFYVFPMRSVNYMMIINKSSGDIKWVKPIFNDSNIFESTMELKGVIREGEISLESFLNL